MICTFRGCDFLPKWKRIVKHQEIRELIKNNKEKIISIWDVPSYFMIAVDDAVRNISVFSCKALLCLRHFHVQ